MKLLLKNLASYVPTPLPTGMAAFDTWADSVIELLGPGFENVPKDDKRYVLASAIQHLGATQSSVQKRHFVRLLRKAAASQVAGQIFMDIKIKQQEAAKAAELAAAQPGPQEATTIPEVANVEAPKN